MLVLFDLASLALLFALVLTPLLRDGGRRLGLLDRPGGRKIHKRPIPRVGGLAVALAYAGALGFVAWAPYRNVGFDLDRLIATVLPLAPALALVLATGLTDDIFGLKPWQKLLGQILAAGLAWRAGFGVQALAGHSLPEWISLPVTVTWLVGCANAVNLIDGMDGLAAGVGLFSALTVLVAALAHESLELAVMVAPLAGSLAGFLRYNFNPASVFLGDSGSLLVGFLLGCYGAHWGQKAATMAAMTAPLMAMAYPLIEVGVSMLRRWIRGQKIFDADQDHIHHQLLKYGLTPRRAAVVLYGVCALGAVLALLQDVAHERFGGLIVLLFCAVAWLGVQHLGYAEFGVAGRLLFGLRMRGIVNAQLQLQQFERDLGAAEDLEEAWAIIARAGREFGFTALRLSVAGKLFHASFAGGSKAAFQIRVALNGDDYFNVECSPGAEVHPTVLAQFPRLVARLLAPWIGSTTKVGGTGRPGPAG